jgi:hypothetical protein
VRYRRSGQRFLAADELDQVVPGHARHAPRRALAAFPQPRALSPPGGKPGLSRKSSTDDALDLRYRQESTRLVPRLIGEVFAKLAPFVFREAVGGTPCGGLWWWGRLLRYCKTAVRVQLLSPNAIVEGPMDIRRSLYDFGGFYLPEALRSYHDEGWSTTSRGGSRLGKVTVRAAAPRSSRFDTRPVPL